MLLTKISRVKVSGIKGDPGKNVKANSGLKKSILDQGWSSFLRMIGYKQVCSKGKFIQVDLKNTSGNCPEFSHISGEDRNILALFKWTDCGYTPIADYVDAVNIKARDIIELGSGTYRDNLWRRGIIRPMKFWLLRKLQYPIKTQSVMPSPVGRVTTHLKNIKTGVQPGLSVCNT